MLPGSARGVSGVFGVSSVLCYTGVSSLALVFFDGVSVGIGIITSVSLYVAYSPEDTRNSGMSSCWMDGMTTRVWNLRCCVACHFVLSLGSERF